MRYNRGGVLFDTIQIVVKKMKGSVLIPKNVANKSVGVPVVDGALDLVECQKNGIPPLAVGNGIAVTHQSGSRFAAIVTGISESFEKDGEILATVFPTGKTPVVPNQLLKFSKDGVSQGWILPDFKNKRLLRASSLIPPPGLRH